MARQPAQLRDEARDEGVAEALLLVDQPLERGAAKDEGLRRLEGDRRRRTRRSVEQRQLAEEIAPAEGGDDRALLAFGRRQDDLHRSALEDEQGIPGIALVEDRLAAPEPADPQVSGAEGKRAVIDLREERAPTEGLERERVLAAGQRHTRIMARTARRPGGPFAASREISPS